MKKRPSDKQMAILRARHAARAIRETVSYGHGWPEKAYPLRGAWEFLVVQHRDWYGWFVWLGHPASPRLSFDPLNDN